MNIQLSRSPESTNPHAKKHLPHVNDSPKLPRLPSKLTKFAQVGGYEKPLIQANGGGNG